MTTETPDYIDDYLIVGAGPAGIQLGYHLKKSGYTYRILERGKAPGTFFSKYPRHRKMISINKVYTGYDEKEVNLRWDWNSILDDEGEILLKDYSKDYFPSADDFVEYLAEYARRFDINIQYNVSVTHIKKETTHFVVTDAENRKYFAARLLMATGVSKPYIPSDVPGIELAENYENVSIDPEDFINQKVLIIGKANSAFETADNLLSTTALVHLVSPNSIKMAWKSHYVGHLRAVNNNFLDTYQLKLQNAILDAKIEKITKQNEKFVVTVTYKRSENEEEELIYDRVIVCTGFRFDSSVFDESCKPELTIENRFPNLTSSWESTNVKGLYFAGTLTQCRDFKKSSSAFIHGFRYNTRTLAKLLEEKYHNVEFPYKTIIPTPKAITNLMIERINLTSALWQQFEYLSDVVVIPKENQAARHYQELPFDYVLESELGKHEQYYILTLEYGQSTSEDPFALSRIARTDTDRASLSNFLHPVIRRYCGPRLVSEHHIIENLFGEWKEKEHIKPLLEYFTREFSSLQNKEMLEAAL